MHQSIVTAINTHSQLQSTKLQREEQRITNSRKRKNLKQTLFVYHATMHDACHNATSIIIHLQRYTLATSNDNE